MVRTKNKISASCSPSKVFDPSICPDSAVTGLSDAEIKQEQAGKREQIVAKLSQQFRVVCESGEDPRQWMLLCAETDWATP